jgi:hypothetical protein
MKNFLLFLVSCCIYITAFSQTPFPCNGNFLFTRQYTTGTNTFVSRVSFIPNDIDITNPGTVTPASFTNASVEYNGFVWTQQWSAAAFTLLKVDATYTGTAFTVAGMPTTNFNNAGVDKNGTMYILTNGTNVNLYAIDLTTTPNPTLKTGFPKAISGLVVTESATWGDISVDPITNKVYAWYHPNPAATSSVRGLYELTNINGVTPAVTKVGAAQDNIMGSLFFNDRGQLFGYGSVGVATGVLQDRFFAIDKATGLATQYGLPDLAVAQSDGCGCSFRISLDRQVSVPILNIPKCGRDTFEYTYTPRNYSNGGATGVTFSDTLDTRLSYAFNAAALQTQLQVTYGAAVAVTLSSDGSGINNVVNITGMNIPVGANSFVLPVLVDATRFATSFSTNEQAYLKNIPTVIGGPNEPSNDPITYNPKDGTQITINLTGTLCLPPVANNFTNAPMPQGYGPTAIPALVAADPDGTIAAYTIKTIPLATEGVLSVPCGTVANPTPAGATCISGFADLTAAVLTANPGGIPLSPSQISSMRFDPAANFTGNAKFTFTATDNIGNVSNTANYILPVTAQPPISNNLMENSMVNTNGPTSIKPLSSADADGTISSYKITTLPTTLQGVVSIPCGTVANPTPAGATCTGGFADLTAAVLTANSGGITLTPAQMAAMRFDPAAGYVGNATFNYNATDNSGNVSNTANYTIPVTATTTTQRPPLADNVVAQPINNSLGATAIPSLKASDLDGTIINYTITSVLPATQGVLSIACGTVANPTPVGATCTGGFADLTPAVLAANGGNIVLTPSQINTLRFDPTAGFIGNATFNYFATDNNNLVSNTASYSIPVVNTPPTAINIITTAPFNGNAAAIVPLSGTDLDGTVTTFNVLTLPTAVQGVLSVPCGTVANPTPAGATCTGGFADLTAAVLTANPTGIPLSPGQAAGIRFDPATGFSGNLGFTYSTTDNNNLVSTVATYSISINNQPPISNDITVAAMPNTNGATAITALNSSDPDGTIASYNITTIPVATSGVLKVPCGTVANPTPAGATCAGGFADITAAVLSANPNGVNLTATQMAGMQFDPAANFTGVVNFTYNAVDNSGNISNVATYNIPITGVGNLPPIANNISAAAMLATNGATAIPSLSGSDPDGTVSSYTLVSVPAASEGILSVACGTVANPTPAGATCTGGFANLTPAVLAANGGFINLTTTQISTLRFDPEPTFTGTANFNYYNTDNTGTVSNLATYTIPVIGLPPVSNPIVAPSMPQTNGPTAIPGLVSSDLDGTIAGYRIDNIPPVSQGALIIPCGTVANPTPVGATCTGGFATLTAATLAANYGGIPLTATQMAAMQFDPVGSYSGNVVFNYHAVDNSGLLSNTASYTIPVTGQPPLSNDILAPKLLNSSGPTAIPNLSSNDPDGTISSYAINSIPPANQGVLSVPCGTVANPTPAGATCIGGFADLTAAVLAANPNGISLTPSQITALRFDPDVTYNGDVIFNYSAFDNNGNISNIATYLIPVGTSAVLPIGALNFNGERNKLNIDLKWNTQNEINVDRYEVYYSTDGNTYQPGGIVAAHNQTNNSYNFVLYNFTELVYFIKLKIIDKNGASKFSDVIVVRNNNKLTSAIYPNPVKDKISVVLGAQAKGSYTMELFDNIGKLITTTTFKNLQNTTTLQMSINKTVTNGLYILKITSLYSNSTEIIKVLVQQ